MTIGSFAALVSMVAFVVTAMFVLFQVRHMRMARNVDISMKLFEWLENEHVRRAMKWVRSQFRFKSLGDHEAYLAKNPDAEDNPMVVIGFFEQVGLLVQKKFVDVDVVMDHLGLQITTMWEKLKPLVSALRESHDDARIGEHFEFLYHQALDYEHKHPRSKS